MSTARATIIAASITLFMCGGALAQSAADPGLRAHAKATTTTKQADVKKSAQHKSKRVSSAAKARATVPRPPAPPASPQPVQRLDDQLDHGGGGGGY